MRLTYIISVIALLMACAKADSSDANLLQQNTIQTTSSKENLLCKEWELVSDMTGDRQTDKPKKKLLVFFHQNYTCNGYLINQNDSLSGTWKLEEKKLMIYYKNKFGKNFEKEYNLFQINDSSMILAHELSFGSAFREFKYIIK